jgi:hypothetical protein
VKKKPKLVIKLDFVKLYDKVGCLLGFVDSYRDENSRNGLDNGIHLLFIICSIDK